MQVTTPEEFVQYLHQMQICTWRHQPRLPWFPSLEAVTLWNGMDVTMNTWFWKDDLHIERKIFYGKLLAPDTPVFVSLDLLPYMIAAQGDIDAHNLHEKGQLAVNAIRVYEHIQRNGPTPTQALPWLPGSRMLYLATLEQKFLLTKYDITGRTRGTYGYRWCLCEEAFPDSFAKAEQIPVTQARDHVIDLLQKHAPNVTPEATAKLFRWQPL